MVWRVRSELLPDEGRLAEERVDRRSFFDDEVDEGSGGDFLPPSLGMSEEGDGVERGGDDRVVGLVIRRTGRMFDVRRDMVRTRLVSRGGRESFKKSMSLAADSRRDGHSATPLMDVGRGDAVSDSVEEEGEVMR